MLATRPSPRPEKSGTRAPGTTCWRPCPVLPVVGRRCRRPALEIGGVFVYIASATRRGGSCVSPASFASGPVSRPVGTGRIFPLIRRQKPCFGLSVIVEADNRAGIRRLHADAIRAAASDAHLREDALQVVDHLLMALEYLGEAETLAPGGARLPIHQIDVADFGVMQRGNCLAGPLVEQPLRGGAGLVTELAVDGAERSGLARPPRERRPLARRRRSAAAAIARHRPPGEFQRLRIVPQVALGDGMARLARQPAADGLDEPPQRLDDARQKRRVFLAEGVPEPLIEEAVADEFGKKFLADALRPLAQWRQLGPERREPPAVDERFDGLRQFPVGIGILAAQPMQQLVAEDVELRPVGIDPDVDDARIVRQDDAVEEA